LVQSSVAKKSNYNWDFHLLADDQTINAFALPRTMFYNSRFIQPVRKIEDQLLSWGMK
jgi:hypothetical protein